MYVLPVPQAALSANHQLPASIVWAGTSWELTKYAIWAALLTSWRITAPKYASLALTIAILAIVVAVVSAATKKLTLESSIQRKEDAFQKQATMTLSLRWQSNVQLGVNNASQLHCAPLVWLTPSCWTKCASLLVQPGFLSTLKPRSAKNVPMIAKHAPVPVVVFLA